MAVGAAATVGYFASKLSGWLVGAIIGFVVGFCFCVSMLEGWQAQAQAALVVARIVIFVGSISLVIAMTMRTFRTSRVVTGALREVGTQIHSDALFRDDGERVRVYANRGRQFQLVVQQTVILAALAAGLRWALLLSANLLILGAIGALFSLCMLFTLLNVARLCMRGPTLVVSPDGLLDNASQIVTGRGLVRWGEIFTVLDYTYKPSRVGATYHMLGIIVTDTRAVRMRQPLLKRALGFIGQGQLPGMIVVSRTLLDQAPDALVTEIKRYARTHAPSGWSSPLIDEDEDEDERDARERGEPGVV